MVAVVSGVGAIIERISQRAVLSFISVSKSVLVNLHLVNLDVNLGIG